MNDTLRYVMLNNIIIIVFCNTHLKNHKLKLKLKETHRYF